MIAFLQVGLSRTRIQSVTWCRVEITPVDGLVNEFEEFPDDPALADFDPDDRKFIAVACAHEDNPPILQAVDSKWRDFLDVLRENDVTVEYICEDYVQNP